MRPGPSPRTVSGVTLLVIAGAFAAAYFKFGWWEFEPLRIPLPSQTPVVEPFQVDLGGPYELILVIDRIPGDSTPWNTREELWRPVDLTWASERMGIKLPQGASRESPWAHIGGVDFEGQTLGGFTAEAGIPYDLTISVNSAETSIGRFNPRICVWSDNRRQPFHSRYFFGFVLGWLGLLTALPGAALLIVPVAWRWVTRRPRHAV